MIACRKCKAVIDYDCLCVPAGDLRDAVEITPEEWAAWKVGTEPAALSAPPSTPTSAPVEDVGGLAWHSIETAPRDGTVFLACNLDRPSFGAWPMYRRVRHFFDGEGEAQRKDLGGWTIVGDLRPDDQEGATVGPEPDLSIAMDDVNRTIRYGWRPLSAPLPVPPAVAWRYEIATAVYPASGRAANWEWRLSETKPSAPEGWVRNLTPLYARPESPALIQPQGEERS